MDWDELIEKLKGHEWNDVEFKAALEECPKSAYPTVSAFANTAGGWLVFGVKEEKGQFEILGVQKVAKVETEFLATLRQKGKISHFPAVRPEKLSDGPHTVLTFFIPESPREAKPVCLEGDIRKSYIRRGSGDHQCTDEEIRTFLREAAPARYDSDAVDMDVTSCFDEESLQWYRAQWQSHNPDKLVGLTNLDFLKHFGLITEVKNTPLPTRAAALLFGTEAAVMKILPRPVADFRRVDVAFDLGIPDEKRWDDRSVMECNLFTAWRQILEHYRKTADVPFALDATTLERHDKPRDYTAFRESIINLLTHQDYGDHTRKASIQVFRDRLVFWNPGCAFVSREEMFQAGDRPVRNPRIVNAFRRIGLGEQAGTGIGAIYSNWRLLKRVPPMIENDKARHSFCLTLLAEELISQEQLLFQAKLGVHLSEDEASLFAQVCREGAIWPLEAKAITGRSGAETDGLLQHLMVQQLIEQRKGQTQTQYVLAPHLRDVLKPKPEDSTIVVPETSLVTGKVGGHPKSLVTDQGKALTTLSETQRLIVQFCDSPRPISFIMKHIGVTNRTFFRRSHLEPLVRGGVLKSTFPEVHQHPKQAYVLTEAGFDLKKKLDAEETTQKG